MKLKEWVLIGVGWYEVVEIGINYIRFVSAERQSMIEKKYVEGWKLA